jgi:hypothetical protein
MSYFAHTYFGASYFPGTYFPPLEDALTGVDLLTTTIPANSSPFAWHWRDWITPDEPTISVDDEAIAIAILLAA